MRWAENWSFSARGRPPPKTSIFLRKSMCWIAISPCQIDHFRLRNSRARNPVVFGPPQSWVLKTATFSDHFRRRNSSVPEFSHFPPPLSRILNRFNFPRKSTCGGYRFCPFRMDHFSDVNGDGRNWPFSAHRIRGSLKCQFF